MLLPTVTQLVIVTYVELFKLQISVSASRSVSRHANESTWQGWKGAWTCACMPNRVCCLWTDLLCKTKLYILPHVTNSWRGFIFGCTACVCLFVSVLVRFNETGHCHHCVTFGIDWWCYSVHAYTFWVEFGKMHITGTKMWWSTECHKVLLSNAI